MESPGKFIDDKELRESIKAGGLGTPATRAEIIEKLIRSNYIERQGKTLIPTPHSFQLLELCSMLFFIISNFNIQCRMPAADSPYRLSG